jgi:uncharacterized membrane protein
LVVVVLEEIKRLQAVRTQYFLVSLLLAVVVLVLVQQLLLGLLVVLPVLGHATWHLYRRLVA